MKRTSRLKSGQKNMIKIKICESEERTILPMKIEILKFLINSFTSNYKIQNR